MVFGEEYNIDKENKGDCILYVEFDHAIEYLKNNKAYGDENLSALLKYTDINI